MEKTKHDELRERCQAYHEQHPEVWSLFVKFSFDLVNRGFKNYSVSGVFDRIRWESGAGEDGVCKFKISNDYKPFYARRFNRMYPGANNFYRMRKQTTKDKPATGAPEVTPSYLEYEELEADYE